MATALQTKYTSLLWLLPLAGPALAVAYMRWWPSLRDGTGAIRQAIETGGYTEPGLAASTPLATVWTHLFGGSAGREGSALHLGAGLASALRPVFDWASVAPQTALCAGLGAGFAAVFGTPLAATLFALEFTRRKPTIAQLIWTAAAALGASFTSSAFGTTHLHASAIDAGWPGLLTGGIWLVFALLLGVLCRVTLSVLHSVRLAACSIIPSSLWRPAWGGVLLLLLGESLDWRPYLGLSLPLLNDALSGTSIDWWVSAAKLLLTAITLGFGFVGGEVTPLFVIGATGASVLATLLQLNAALAARVGMCTLFGLAARTPLAAIGLALELFGWRVSLHVFACYAVGLLVAGTKALPGYMRSANNRPQ